MAAQWFYNCHSQIVNRGEIFIRLERIYCLDLGQFSPTDWHTFQGLYSHLPGWQGDGPWWFGGEGEEVFLMGTGEREGWRMVGVLPLADWQLWDRLFQRLVTRSGLPRFFL